MSEHTSLKGKVDTIKDGDYITTTILGSVVQELNDRLKDVGSRPVSVPKGKEDDKYDRQFRTENTKTLSQVKSQLNTNNLQQQETFG